MCYIICGRHKKNDKHITFVLAKDKSFYYIREYGKRSCTVFVEYKHVEEILKDLIFRAKKYKQLRSTSKNVARQFKRPSKIEKILKVYNIFVANLRSDNCPFESKIKEIQNWVKIGEENIFTIKRKDNFEMKRKLKLLIKS